MIDIRISMEPAKYMGKRGQRQEQNTTSVTPPKKTEGLRHREREEKKRRGQEGCRGRRKEI